LTNFQTLRALFCFQQTEKYPVFSPPLTASIPTTSIQKIKTSVKLLWFLFHFCFYVKGEKKDI